eukprot:TRINITY_DN3169_c0_g2_i1.p1 TRINITY_DN3169_c0_g2~~TRINITY_DN3169_c0_g2_i1.p1  ORF type:complete len:300 (+),score=46.23 TRINITY_DN3169_c0_g2_i1:53-952(+)
MLAGHTDPMDLGCEPEFEPIEPPEDLICPICSMLMTDAVQTSCEHYFCKKCINKIVNNSQKTAPSCPLCRVKCTPLQKASRIVISLISKQRIRCGQSGCQEVMTRDMWDAHLAECQYIPIPCPNLKYGCTKQLTRSAMEEHIEKCPNKPLLLPFGILNTCVDTKRANQHVDVIDLPLPSTQLLSHRNCLTFEIKGDSIGILRPGIVSIALAIAARVGDNWQVCHEREHGVGIQINNHLVSYTLFPRRSHKGDCVSATLTHHSEVKENDVITFRVGMAAKKILDDLQANDISIRWDSIER